jgi:hypothetical protein
MPWSLRQVRFLTDCHWSLRGASAAAKYLEGGFPMKRGISGLLSACCMILVLASVAWGQAGSSTIRGEVTDAQGRQVSGATVTIKNASTGFSRAQVTTSTGSFTFELIPPGDYAVEVEVKGFKKAVRNVSALVSAVIDANVQLEVGSLSETVKVEAADSAVAADTEDAALGNNFEHQQITELPLESRNVLNLLTLQPGVTKDGYVAGARSDQSNVTLDGVDVNDAQTTSVSNNRDNPTVSTKLAGPVSGPVLRLNAEAIEEFRVSTVTSSASAGHSAGAQIDLVTKSGTNTFHGSLFESHRNTITTANDFFNNLNGIPRPKLIRNLFSGALGGPILKDRLFFFYNYEGRRDASSLPSDPNNIPRVPLPSLGQGLVKFPNGGTQGGLITLTPADIKTIFPDTGGENPAAVAALAAAAAKYPANDFSVGDSNPTQLLNVAGFRFNASAPVQQNSHVAKLDLNINPKQTLFVRANVIYDHDSSVALPFFPDTLPLGLWSHPWGLTVGHTWTIRNSLVNNFHYGMTRQSFSQHGDLDANHIWFRFVFDPTSNTQTQSRTTPVQNFVDDISWVKGKHTVQFGVYLARISNNRAQFTSSFDSATTNPSFYATNLIRNAVNNYLGSNPGKYGVGASIGAGAGSAVENAIAALIGRYTQYTGAVIYAHDGTVQPVGTPSARTFKTQGYEGYTQDVWKMNQSLTLTLGLRYSLWRPVYETHGFEVQPDIPLSEFLRRRIAGAAAGQPYLTPISVNLSGPANGGPPMYNWDKTNFLPRLAAAWSPRFDHGLLGTVFGRKGQSVIRGGFSIAGDYFGEQLASSFDLNNTLGFSSSTTIAANTYNVGCGPYVTQTNCKSNVGPLFTGFNQDVRTLPGIPPAAPLTFPQMKPSDGKPRIESSLDSQLQTPKEYIWSLTFERELPAHLLLQASYIGREGQHLLAQRDVMNPIDLTDPKSKMDWYTAATILEKLRQVGTPCDLNNCSKIPTIPYFENLFPNLAQQEGFKPTGYTPTSTQALYASEVYNTIIVNGAVTGNVNGNDWTTTQLDIDTFSPIAPHAFYQPQYGALQVFSTIGHSYYHALAMSLRERLKDVTFDLNYTYSHSTDDASGLQTSANYGAALILNPFRPQDSYGNSDFDIRHQVNFNSVVQLPLGRGRLLGRDSGRVLNAFIGGWQVSSIFRWNTGLPVGFYGDTGLFDDARWATNWEVQSNTTRTRNFQTCPTRGPIPKLFGCNTTLAYQSVRNAYPGETGDRNVFRVPGYVVADAGLSKTFDIRERQKLQFRWEVFNLTNTQKMGQYNASRSGFGITLDPSTQLPPSDWSNFTGIQGTPRVMQFALRYSF